MAKRLHREIKRQRRVASAIHIVIFEDWEIVRAYPLKHERIGSIPVAKCGSHCPKFGESFLMLLEQWQQPDCRLLQIRKRRLSIKTQDYRYPLWMGCVAAARSVSPLHSFSRVKAGGFVSEIINNQKQEQSLR